MMAVSTDIETIGARAEARAEFQAVLERDPGMDRSRVGLAEIADSPVLWDVAWPQGELQVERTRDGRYPAYLEACPVGARKFGNLLDPESEIRKVMETKRVFVFKQELATSPQFYYFYAT